VHASGNDRWIRPVHGCLPAKQQIWGTWADEGHRVQAGAYRRYFEIDKVDQTVGQFKKNTSVMIVIMILGGLVLAAVMLQSKEGSENTRPIEQMLPLWKLEHDCILSKNGDVTVAFRLVLPEIFSLSNDDYEALHHTWLKAIRILPAGSILHKQDYFIRSAYKGNFNSDNSNFLMRSSERFFNERPYLDHSCYVMITLRHLGRKPASSAFSNLLRRNIIQPERTDTKLMQQLLDITGQFRRILSDNGSIEIYRLTEAEITGTAGKPGLLERYLYLLEEGQLSELKDIVFKPELKIGEHHCQLYTLADAEDLPAACGPRTGYDKYSTDKTRFSVGFASPIGQLLPVNHIYNQFLLIGDTQSTVKRLESKRLRLRSLSAYSRETPSVERRPRIFLTKPFHLEGCQ